MPVAADVDHAARTAIRAHHSATHLLHEALRRRLGTHVAQKGSLNAPDRLRFDVSHPRPITGEDIAVVEAEVNRSHRENAEVITRLMTLDAAREDGRHGAVRREIRRGGAGRDDGRLGGQQARLVDRAVRRHACPPHRRHRPIPIVGESAVAAGVRRIEAKTRDEARKKLTAESRGLAELAGLLRAPADEAPKRLESLIDDKRKLERELADARRKLAMGGGGAGPGDSVREIAGVKFYARAVTGIDMKDLKSLADEAKQSVGSGVVAIAATAEDGKASLVVAVTPDQTGRFNAVDLVRLGSAALGGKGGGGRPDMAQAGGPDGANAGKALEAVEEAIRARA